MSARMPVQPYSSGQVLPFRQSLFAVLGMCLVMMMVAIDQTVVGTALPTAVAELRGFDWYAWVATSYLLTSVITIPIFGRLGDYYGRKPFVLGAIALFTLASALCATAQSMPMLVFARALQGVGGGMLVGTGFACIPDLFPEPRVRLRWQVMFSSAFGIANAIGPTLGGLLTEHYGWRSVFYVNLPVGLLGACFVMRFLPHLRHYSADEIRLDWVGALLIAASLGSWQLTVELLPRSGATPAVLALAAAGTVGFWALYKWERRCPHPIVPLTMFRNRSLAVLCVLALLTGVVLFSLLFYVPLLLQGGFGLSPQQAGMLITPMVACITLGSIVNGRIITRIEHPNVMFYAGFVLLVLACLGIVGTHAGTAHGLFALYMFAAGLGMGFVLPNLTVFIQQAAGRAQLGIATAMQQSLRMVGGMIGTALMGTVVGSRYASDLDRMLRAGDGHAWLEPLRDPQILVTPEAHAQFLASAAQHGQDGVPLIEAARTTLVGAIHSGLLITLAVAVLALCYVRRLPPTRLARIIE